MKNQHGISALKNQEGYELKHESDSCIVIEKKPKAKSKAEKLAEYGIGNFS